MTAKPRRTSELKSQKKTGWNRQHHHDLSHVQENGDNRSGLEGERRRKKGRMIYLLNS